MTAAGCQCRCSMSLPHRVSPSRTAACQQQDVAQPPATKDKSEWVPLQGPLAKVGSQSKLGPELPRTVSGQEIRTCSVTNSVCLVIQRRCSSWPSLVLCSISLPRLWIVASRGPVLIASVVCAKGACQSL